MLIAARDELGLGTRDEVLGESLPAAATAPTLELGSFMMSRNGTSLIEHVFVGARRGGCRGTAAGRRHSLPVFPGRLTGQANREGRGVVPHRVSRDARETGRRWQEEHSPAYRAGARRGRGTTVAARLSWRIRGDPGGARGDPGRRRIARAPGSTGPRVMRYSACSASFSGIQPTRRTRPAPCSTHSEWSRASRRASGPSGTAHSPAPWSGMHRDALADLAAADCRGFAESGDASRMGRSDRGTGTPGRSPTCVGPGIANDAGRALGIDGGAISRRLASGAHAARHVADVDPACFHAYEAMCRAGGVANEHTATTDGLEAFARRCRKASRRCRQFRSECATS